MTLINKLKISDMVCTFLNVVFHADFKSENHFALSRQNLKISTNIFFINTVRRLLFFRRDSITIPSFVFKE